MPENLRHCLEMRTMMRMLFWEDRGESVQELIPHDLSYDWQMTVNIFGPGTHHGFIETHLQEHGLYCLEERPLTT